MDHLEPLPQALPVFTDSTVAIDVGESFLNALLSANNAPMGIIGIVVAYFLVRLFRRKPTSE